MWVCLCMCQPWNNNTMQAAAVSASIQYIREATNQSLNLKIATHFHLPSTFHHGKSEYQTEECIPTYQLNKQLIASTVSTNSQCVAFQLHGLHRVWHCFPPFVAVSEPCPYLGAVWQRMATGNHVTCPSAMSTVVVVEVVSSVYQEWSLSLPFPWILLSRTGVWLAYTHQGHRHRHKSSQSRKTRYEKL